MGAKGRGEGGQALLWVVVAVVAVTLVATGTLALVRTSLGAEGRSVAREVAWWAAEAGLRRALVLLEAVPSWRTGSQPWRGELPLGDRAAEYEVTVENTGQAAPPGVPLLRVASTGRYRSAVQTVEARVGVEPPRFFDAALAVYGDWVVPGDVSMSATGAVYVAGRFDITNGSAVVCIQGDLIAATIAYKRMTHECPMGQSGRDAVLAVQRQPEPLTGDTFRARPKPPLAWYRWVERQLWEGIYGTEVPRITNAGEMLSLAAERPFGALFVVDGDVGADFWAGGDRHGRKRQCDDASSGTLTVRGKVTLVVTGEIVVCPTSIEYDGEGRFAVIANRIHFNPSKAGKENKRGEDTNRGPGRPDDPGPPNGKPGRSSEVHRYEGLYYAYDLAPSGSTGDKGAGVVDFEVGSYELTGVLAAGEVQLRGKSQLHLASAFQWLQAGAPPGVPGMRAVVYEWLPGSAATTRVRWEPD